MGGCGWVVWGCDIEDDCAWVGVVIGGQDSIDSGCGGNGATIVDAELSLSPQLTISKSPLE